MDVVIQNDEINKRIALTIVTLPSQLNNDDDDDVVIPMSSTINDTVNAIFVS